MNIPSVTMEIDQDMSSQLVIMLCDPIHSFIGYFRLHMGSCFQSLVFSTTQYLYEHSEGPCKCVPIHRTAFMAT